jgi:hypothetical protein
MTQTWSRSDGDLSAHWHPRPLTVRQGPRRVSRLLAAVDACSVGSIGTRVAVSDDVHVWRAGCASSSEGSRVSHVMHAGRRCIGHHGDGECSRWRGAAGGGGCHRPCRVRKPVVDIRSRPPGTPRRPTRVSTPWSAGGHRAAIDAGGPAPITAAGRAVSWRARRSWPAQAVVPWRNPARASSPGSSHVGPSRAAPSPARAVSSARRGRPPGRLRSAATADSTGTR